MATREHKSGPGTRGSISELPDAAPDSTGLTQRQQEILPFFQLSPDKFRQDERRVEVLCTLNFSQIFAELSTMLFRSG